MIFIMYVWPKEPPEEPDTIGGGELYPYLLPPLRTAGVSAHNGIEK
jgi:hypothetical protein